MKSLSRYIIGQAIRKCHLYLIITILLTVAFSSVAVADEAHEEAEHEFHRHHMALILGNTQNDGSENGLSVGLDYEYRFNKWLGLGGLAEYAGGTEVHKEHEGHGEDKRTRDWVVRTGVAYQFPFGERYTIGPEFNVDFSEHETLFVYGIAIGLGF